MNHNDRYSRQQLVSQFGELGQLRLQQAHVLIVGTGGLGCTIANHLAGAGIGHLTLIDHDLVSISNLHRQILFSEKDIGLSKAEQAKKALTLLNSDVKITSITNRLSKANALTLCRNSDLVIDAADTFLSSFLLSDSCFKLGVPMLTASVNQTFGYVAGVCGDAPSLRAIFPRLPQQNTSCDIVGVTGPSVGIIASIQAQEALKLLIRSKENILGEIIHFDLWAMQAHKIDFSTASEPNTKQLEIISVQQAIDSNKIIVDVREDKETSSKPQNFAVQHQIPLALLQAGEHQLKSSNNIALCCQSGQRALIAGQALIDQGFSNVQVISPA